MPVEIEFAGPLEGVVLQTELSPGVARAESDYRLYLTFSHLYPHYLIGASPVVSVSLADFNDRGDQPLKLRWEGVDGLDQLPGDAMLLVNLVARTSTVHHAVTHAVVGTGAIALSRLLTGNGVQIHLRDRAAEGILNWGLQDGPKPSAEVRTAAVEKGSLSIGSARQTQGGHWAPRPASADWDTARTEGEQLSRAMLDDISKNFSERMPGLPRECISYNMPFYAHHYPPEGGEPLYVPSFVCFNKRALVGDPGSLGIRHALIRLLHISLHEQNMTVSRFVGAITEQMNRPAKDRAEPSADFYRCVHACVGALTLPALCRPYRYDGSCIKTTAVRPKSQRQPRPRPKQTALGGANYGVEELTQEFDTRMHVMTDQLAIWGQDNADIALDCEDGCLMSKQLFHLVKQVFGVGGDYGDEGRCWASVLDLFEPICTRNYCQSAGPNGGLDGAAASPISHILLLLVDRITFANAMVRGCNVRSQVAGDPSPDLAAVTNRLQDYLSGEKHPWMSHLGFFAAETTAWQVPELTLTELAHGQTAADEKRWRRVRRLQQYLFAKYRNNTPLLRDYSQLKNHGFDVAGQERANTSREAYIKHCLDKPNACRLYPFYHIITNGDVDRGSICQPRPGEPGNMCTAVIFNSLRDQSYMHCGTFLQRLALDPESAVFIPAGPFVSQKSFRNLMQVCEQGQWPSLYFIDESLRPSGKDGVEQAAYAGASDLLVGTPKRLGSVGVGLIRTAEQNPLAPAEHYGGGGNNVLCFKMLVRSGVVGQTAFAGSLEGFLHGTEVSDFTVVGWDYFRYNIAETHGTEDANSLYLIRVFLRYAPLTDDGTSGSSSSKDASA